MKTGRFLLIFSVVFLIGLIPVGADTPLHWWNFDETSGLTVHDIGTSPVDCTVMFNSTPHLWVAGKFGNAINFTGSNLVDCGNSSSLNLGSGDYSLEYWVRHSCNASICGAIFSKVDCETFYAWTVFIIGDGKPQAILDDYSSNSDSIEFNPEIRLTDDNQWHHIVYTHVAGGNISLYQDGDLIFTNTSDNPNLGNIYHLSFGSMWLAYPSSALYYFTGMVDEIRIWHRALNTTEIGNLYLYNNLTAPPPPPIPNPLRDMLSEVGAGTGNFLSSISPSLSTMCLGLEVINLSLG